MGKIILEILMYLRGLDGTVGNIKLVTYFKKHEFSFAMWGCGMRYKYYYRKNSLSRRMNAWAGWER
ncbi:MAG: hypothetical protein K0Q53_1323 [Massilibacillus sp.]|jgi:hypothetical protein|nr:hypothetical protein [Massilibacillus sp.]